MNKAPPQPTEAERRERRQAEALRANLRRRKARGEADKNDQRSATQTADDRQNESSRSLPMPMAGISSWS